MRTGELLETLRDAGLVAGAMEVAEALWLAATVDGLTALGLDTPGADEPVVDVVRADDPSVDEPTLDLGEPTLDLGLLGGAEADRTAAEPVTGVPLNLEVAGEPDAVETAGRSVPVRTAPALPTRSALVKALRPLKRRMDTGRLDVLDEDATVQYIAGGGPFNPVFRPAQERWLDAVVVVDAAPSMDLWTGVATELQMALRQLGGFRDVRLWYLHAAESGDLHIARTATSEQPGDEMRHPGELVDFSGRRVYLVLTDATADAWRNGSAAPVLSSWAQRGYVAIVQPLPERLWPRTALRVRNGTFLSFRPGTFTSEQTFVERRRRPRTLVGTETPVPVMELGATWFASWSRSVAGATDGGVEMAAAVISSEPQDGYAPPASPLTSDAGSLVATYFATASPDACRLAVCLAAAPVDLQVIRLIQRVMVPSSGPAEVAEVLLSGLLRRVDIAAATPQVLHRFEFRPGVRDLLMDELRLSDMREVVQAVSDYVSGDGRGSDDTFEAIATVEGGTHVAVVDRPFAWMPPELIERLTPATPPAPAIAPPARPRIAAGEILAGRYRLHEQTKRSVISETWRGTDEVLSRTVLVVLPNPALLNGPEQAIRFLQDARALTTIDHPGVVKVFDYSGAGDVAFLITEFLDGETLARMVGRVGRPSLPRVMELVAQAAEGLEAAHSKGVRHRDVTPESLLLRPDGRLVVTDFRLAERIPDETYVVGPGVDVAELSAAPYVSPEHATGLNGTVASDIYSLGAVAFRCLTGRPPFEGDSAVEIRMKALREATPSLPADIPSIVRSVVDRAMAKDAAARWLSAAAFAAAAREAARTLETTSSESDERMAPYSGGVRPGVTLGGRYRLDQRIAIGGIGDVWRGSDEVLGRSVAVKILLPALLDEPGFAERFRGEARTMATINHPGVVDVYDYGSDQQLAFLVMEYVEAETLTRVLKRAGRLAPARTMALVAQAADALQAAHVNGLVHRDVNPRNVLVRPNGTLVLTNFGIARSAMVGRLTGAGSVLGTASYISPEQASGAAATAASDVYALGVVAYQCLSGHRPFDGATPIEIAMKHVRDNPPPLPMDVPHPVRNVVERAMVKESGSRWPTAADMARAARQAVSPASPAAPEKGATVYYRGADTVVTPSGRASLPAPAVPPRLRDVLAELEQKMDRIYPPPRRLLRRNLTAAMVVREMVRAAEAMTSEKPNRFVISLSVADYERFTSWDPPVNPTFKWTVGQFFDQLGWSTARAIVVEFIADNRYRQSRFHVFAEVVTRE